MDSSPSPPVLTPPSRRSKVSTLCLVRPHEESRGREDDDPGSPHASPSSLKKRQPHFPPLPPPPQQQQQHHLPDHLPLRELILLSPTRRRPRSRAADVENINPSAVAPKRRRSKSKGRSLTANVDLMGCASPRNARRPRGRPAKVAREEEFGFFEEEVVKVRRRKKKQQQDKSACIAVNNESFSLVPVAVPTAPDETPRITEAAGGNEVASPRGVFELVMWKDVARSSLWFGFGSLCFLSSCFSRDLSFNFVSAVSHVGLFALALAFFYDAFSERWEERRRHPRYTLKEEDILRAIRLILPTANAVIAVAQVVFSGEPSMTLKVAPVLLFIAKYSHIITLGRLLAVAFFVTFTVPRLLSCYSHLIRHHVDSIKLRSIEAWADCRYKRMVALSCGTIFWNLFGVRTRIIAAFLAVVILRYHRQQNCSEVTERVEVEEKEQDKEERKQENMVVIEEETTKKEL